MYNTKKNRNETNNEQTSIAAAAASSYVKEESYKVNAMMMYFIATYTHATTTSLERYTHVCTRCVHDGSGKCMWRKEEKRVSSNEEYSNNACHTIVCSFICLSACSYVRPLACSLARSPTHSFTHSFVFLSLGVLFIILFVLVFFFMCMCVCVCVCMAPLLSLDTLLVVFIPFYHYVNSESEKRMSEESWYLVLILTLTHRISLPSSS